LGGEVRGFVAAELTVGRIVDMNLRPRGVTRAVRGAVKYTQQKRGAVAQLVRVPACHAGGCGFESRRPRRVANKSPIRLLVTCYRFESH
jgi:hypothetical protein